jgi:hypothetical protein
MPSAAANEIITALQNAGYTVERASGGPIPDSEADRHDAAGLELQDPGTQIVRITGPDLDVTVPALADNLRDVLANHDAAPQRADDTSA